MIKGYKIFTVLFVILFYSCIDCEKLDLSYRKDNLEVVLTAKPTIFGDMKFVGTELNSSKINTTVMTRRWYREYIDSMQIGDTVIKRKGDIILSIHKKDTIINITWVCEGLDNYEIKI